MQMNKKFYLNDLYILSNTLRVKVDYLTFQMDHYLDYINDMNKYLKVKQRNDELIQEINVLKERTHKLTLAVNSIQRIRKSKIMEFKYVLNGMFYFANGTSYIVIEFKYLLDISLDISSGAITSFDQLKAMLPEPVIAV